MTWCAGGVPPSVLPGSSDPSFSDLAEITGWVVGWNNWNSLVGRWRQEKNKSELLWVFGLVLARFNSLNLLWVRWGIFFDSVGQGNVSISKTGIYYLQPELKGVRNALKMKSIKCLYNSQNAWWCFQPDSNKSYRPRGPQIFVKAALPS